MISSIENDISTDIDRLSSLETVIQAEQPVTEFAKNDIFTKGTVEQPKIKQSYDKVRKVPMSKRISSKRDTASSDRKIKPATNVVSVHKVGFLEIRLQ